MSFSHDRSGSGAVPDGHKNSSSASGSPLYAGQRHSYARSEWDGTEIPEEHIAPTLELPTMWTYMESTQEPAFPHTPRPQQAPPSLPPSAPEDSSSAPRYLPQRGFNPSRQEPAPTEPIPVISRQTLPPTPQAVTPEAVLSSQEALSPVTDSAPAQPNASENHQTSTLPEAAEALPKTPTQASATPAPTPVAPTSLRTATPYSSTHINPQVAPSATPAPPQSGFAPPGPQPVHTAPTTPSGTYASGQGHPQSFAAPTLQSGQNAPAPSSTQPSAHPTVSAPVSGSLPGAGHTAPAAASSPTASALTPAPPSQSLSTTTVKPLSLMATLSVGSGVLAFLVSWIPYVSVLGYFFSLAALILGVIALVQTMPKGKYRGMGLAITGCVLSFSPVVVAIALQALSFGALGGGFDASAEDPAAVEQSAASEAPDEADTSAEQEPAPSPQGGTSTQDAPTPQTSPDQQAPSSERGTTSPSIPSPTGSDHLVDSPELVSVGTGEIADGRMLATITNAAKAGPDDEGRPTVLVTIVLTNKHPRDTVTFLDAEMQVYQNGEALEMSFYEKNAPRGYDPKLYVSDINPGDSRIFHVPFALEDDRSPITVEIGSSFSDGKVAKDFSLR